MTNQKQEFPVAAMFVNGSDQMSNLYRGPSKDESTKFQFICLNAFRGEYFLEINQKKELPVAAMFVKGSGRNEQSL